MIRTNLRYHRPSTPEEACGLLAEHDGNVAVLAGGTQLLPLMYRDQVRLEHLVDLRDLGLNAISASNGHVEIGATVAYADVLASEVVQEHVPLLARAAATVTGGRQITQQATLVGSACFNFPSSDMPGVLVALDATFRIHSTSGTREASASSFLRGAHSVDLEPGEFVSSFIVQRQGAGGYCKLKHSSGSWPIATASAIDAGNGGIRVTVGAVQAVPVTVEVAQASELKERLREALPEPWTDVLAPGWYRSRVAPVAAARAITDLMEISQ